MTEEKKSGSSTPAETGLWKKLAAVAAIAVGGGILYALLGDRLSLDYLANQEVTLRQFQADQPLLVYGGAFLIYVVATGLSLPGAAAMTLIIGWYFGLIRGVILVSFASTLGATLAFLLSRFILRDSIQARFGDWLHAFDQALEREGAFYLFTLRLIPAVPFFVINLVMGLTGIRTWTFWWVSQLGMLAGTTVFIYAGSTIPGLAQLADPSQLRPADVRDWTEFVERIGPDCDQLSPGASIRAQLDEDSRIIVDSLATGSGKIDEEQTSILLDGLNAALIRPDFALAPAWNLSGRSPASTVTVSDQKQVAAERAAQTRLTSINRSILVAAMPGVISAPQPILSKQMVLAFALLGTFPLIVKKFMARLRKNRDSSMTPTN